MKRMVWRWVCLALLSGGVAAAQPAPRPSGPDYAPERVIVKLAPSAAATVLGRNGAVPAGLATALGRARVREARPLFGDLWPSDARGPVRAADRAAAVRARFPARAARAPQDVALPELENILLLTLESGAEVTTAVAELQGDPSVIYAEPDYRVTVFAVPNDPYYGSSRSWGQSYPDLWGLRAIKAASAWDVTTGSNSVVIAVVDTGLDFSHPDIQGRIWSNPGEIAGNGLDDDGNGYVDDTRGWDFTSDDNDPRDGHGHGTHCAGTIGAATNNGIGVAGINWSGKIMAVKGLDDWGGGYDSGLALAMRYAADNGAEVMSNSWGGYGFSQLLQDAVNHCYAQGCIVVAAAGNEYDDARYYGPAGLRNVVCVAASQYGDGKADFSNFGTRIDVTAPGVDILSLRAAGTDMYGDGMQIVGSEYYRSDGTSMACPHVSGALGLLVSAHPTWSTAEVIGQLVGTADYIDSVNLDFTDRVGAGRISLQQALSSTSLRKRMVVESFDVDDSEGDDDNEPDAGERIRLSVTIRHLAGTSTGVTATLSSADPSITVVTPTAALGGLSGWRTANNAANPFVIDVSSGWPGRRPVALKLTLSTPGYLREEEIRLFTPAGWCWPFTLMPEALGWEEAASGTVEVVNIDYLDWRSAAGYQLLSREGANRWGGPDWLPLSSDTGWLESSYFDLTLAAPPVSTIAYVPPVDPNLPGVTGALPVAWEFCRGLIPLEGGLAWEGIAISRFSDIQPGTTGAWARFYVEECAGRVPLIVGGYDDGTYRPAGAVDRAAMAVFMSRALRLNLGTYQGLFSDVPSSHWAAQYIEAVAEAGIVGGYSDGTYRPNGAVTRDMMAVFVARGLAGGEAGVPPGPTTATFSDVPTTHWAYKYVEYTVAQGVVGGYDNGTYRPSNPVTRDAMAVFMYRGFIQPEASAVALAGPAVTAVNPATGGRCGWLSASSGPAANPGYAYIAFDAVRFGTALAYGGAWEVKFELRQAASPQTPATGSYTKTVSLSASAMTAARNLALSSGDPYHVVSWDISAGLTAGSYLLVVSVEDETGAWQEVARQPAFAIAP